MTSSQINSPLFDQAFIAAVVDAVRKDPSVETALLEDFDGTVKNLGLNSPVSGKLSKNGNEYMFRVEGEEVSLLLETPIGANGELSDRDLDIVAGGGFKEWMENVWKSFTSGGGVQSAENSKVMVELHPIDRQP